MLLLFYICCCYFTYAVVVLHMLLFYLCYAYELVLLVVYYALRIQHSMHMLTCIHVYLHDNTSLFHKETT